MFGRDYADNNLIFCQPGGQYHSPDREGARVSELMRKVGLQGVTLHSLRHSHASILLSKGVPISVVSERLGYGGSEHYALDLASGFARGCENLERPWLKSSRRRQLLHPSRRIPECRPELRGRVLPRAAATKRAASQNSVRWLPPLNSSSL